MRVAWAVLIPLIFLSRSFLPVAYASEIQRVLTKLNEAYAQVEDYQANVEIRIPSHDGHFNTKEFLYTYKKPELIRVDMKSPHRGTVLVYPDERGRVLVRPAGLASFLRLRLDPNNPFLKAHSGQRIDQTHLGILIDKIEKSLTTDPHGKIRLDEEPDSIEIHVVAEDHFREGALTRYTFLIDKTLWLPVEIQERNREGDLERLVVFRNLRTNIGVSESFFKLGG